jgi:serine/threonine protein kinase
LLTINEVLGIIQNIVHTICELHKNNIVYCDLKAEQILVSRSEGKCFLADFGGAKFIWDERTSLGEILTGNEGIKFLTKNGYD